MSPLEQKVEELERKVAALQAVENVAFIENIKRRASTGLTLNTGGSLSGTTIAVRDATDTTTETVADDYDGIFTVEVGGVSYKIGYYNI